MNKFLLALLAASSLSAFAQAPASTCEAQAAEKKLAGAAKNSFLKKCERDAAAHDGRRLATNAVRATPADLLALEHD